VARPATNRESVKEEPAPEKGDANKETVPMNNGDPRRHSLPIRRDCEGGARFKEDKGSRGSHIRLRVFHFSFFGYARHHLSSTLRVCEAGSTPEEKR
jgi:hypothetical protein